MSNSDKFFCYFPFVHANIRANKNRQVAPCWRSDEILGNLDDNTLEEIWNGDAYKALRQKFLNGEKPEGCSRCWKLEENNETKDLSLRSWYLKHYAKYADNIDNPKLKSIELRFSNLCNYSCLHCDTKHSSTWNNKAKKHSELADWQKVNHNNPQIIWPNEIPAIIDSLNDVDEIRVTGGEPLTDPTFYSFLEQIPLELAKNIELLVVTNLSKLNDALELFNKFKEVKLRVSVDADEETYSYFRSGGNIEIIKQNIALAQKHKNVTLSGVCAVNLLNITRLSNIYDFYNRHNIFFKVMFVQDRPTYLDIRNLPQSLKDKTNKELEQLQKTVNEFQVEEIQRVIDYMNSREPDNTAWNDLLVYTSAVDKVNNTSFANTYPELQNVTCR